MKKGFNLIAIDLLKVAPWNYKEVEGDSKRSTMMGSKLGANIKKRGQIESVVVRESGKKFEIINGNHRLQKFKDAKIKKVMCFNYGKISIEEARMIALELNETKFAADPNKLAETLNSISKKFGMEEIVKTIPFTEIEMEGFENLFNHNAAKAKAIAGEGEPPVTHGIAKGPKGNSSGEFVKLSYHMPRKMHQRFMDSMDRIKSIRYPDTKPEDIKMLDPLHVLIKLCEESSDEAVRDA